MRRTISWSSMGGVLSLAVALFYPGLHPGEHAHEVTASRGVSVDAHPVESHERAARRECAGLVARPTVAGVAASAGRGHALDHEEPSSGSEHPARLPQPGIEI